jgi:hypothetical protein
MTVERKHADIWMAQYSGEPYYLLDQRAEDVCLDSLARAMQNNTRYNGQTQLPLPIASHCCYVERLVRARWPDHLEAQLYALVHDCHEAFWGDLLRPVQLALAVAIPGFRDVWHRLLADADRAIFTAMGFSREFPTKVARDRVKLADSAALWFERYYLMDAANRSAVWRDDDASDWWRKSPTRFEPVIDEGREWRSHVEEVHWAWRVQCEWGSTTDDGKK